VNDTTDNLRYPHQVEFPNIVRRGRENDQPKTGCGPWLQRALSYGVPATDLDKPRKPTRTSVENLYDTLEKKDHLVYVYKKFHATATTTCRCTICHVIVDHKETPTGPFCSPDHFQEWKRRVDRAIKKAYAHHNRPVSARYIHAILRGEIPWEAANVLQGIEYLSFQ